MECPRCRQQYTTEGDFQPRIIITCGHSFCRKCVTVLRNDAGMITCPQCGQLSNEADAPNVALMSYIEVQRQRLNPGKVRDLPHPRQATICQHCNQSNSTYVCFQCLPAGFRFCKTCCESEHDRPFGPVRQHKPVPIEQATYGAILPDCPKHSEKLCELFSFTENRFACEECMHESSYIAENFIDIEGAVEYVRDTIPSLVSKVTSFRERLQATQGKLNEKLGRIDQAKMTAVDKVRVEFQDFEMALRKRLAYVESQVEENAGHQKKLLNEQLEQVEVALGSTATSIIQANMLNQMQDYSLLQRAPGILGQMKQHITDQNDDILNEPIVSSEISFYVGPEFQKAIDNLGKVGGGTTPTDFTCTSDGGIVLLTWQSYKNDEIEFEIVCDIVITEPDNSTPSTTNPFPRQYRVSGKQQWIRIDNLFPGTKYRFRIRSCDESGWGWWSSSIFGYTPDFPLLIGFTDRLVKDRLVKIPLPCDGLYRIVARGAKATDGEKRKGGKGAIIEAQFLLNKGDYLEILVGGMSQKKGPSSGGGGGSFVGLNGRQDLLIAAGGGGGTRGYDDQDVDGMDASLDHNGSSGTGDQWAGGGNSGRAGKDAVQNGSCWGFGGAGHYENSTSAQSFVAGGMGGDGGGFGCGGGVGQYGGGGGGGYSGGGGGRGGGGGGSYVREDGLNIVRSLGNEDNGSVLLEKIKDADDP